MEQVNNAVKLNKCMGIKKKENTESSDTKKNYDHRRSSNLLF